ncbi:uncharacterized protein LOC111113432 [Crassostrea virginica]
MLFTLCLCFGFAVLSSEYENIALHKPTYQEFPYQVSSSIGRELIQAGNAVDGLKSNRSIWGGQCTQSASNQQTATWWVNLTSILSIHHITIYYRTENSPWDSTSDYPWRFLGFSIYVSNTTDRFQGTLCYKDTEFNISTIPAVFNTTCLVHGQYVIYYNERLQGATYPNGYSKYAFNEICELEVFGCSIPGYYGYDCSIPCPEHCLSSCHIETGACLGCAPGYLGHRCESDCPYGYFGQNCAMVCNSTCTGCDNVNGVCDTGCHPGWKGDFCQEKCLSGTYGYNCSGMCGHCLDLSYCSHVDGTCQTGCGPGYHGRQCKEECEQNTYGTNCSKLCGNCLNKDQCHHANGSCLNGCNPGFQGDKCLEACDSGYYGLRCKQECSSFCKQSRDCHHVTGFCKDGCKSGWQGNDCFEVLKNTECDTDWQSRFYGMTGAFCVTFIILITHVIITRNEKKCCTRKHLQDHTAKQKESHYMKTYENEAVDPGYQELGEFNTSSTIYYNK